jgi:hypothetical protein
MAMKPGYKVEQIGPVKEQVRTLAARATVAGIYREYAQAMHLIVKELQTRPLEWGDPEWQTHKAGGMVCHGTVDPLFVRYVVYEQERYVCILKVMPMSHSRLD